MEDGSSLLFNKQGRPRSAAVLAAGSPGILPGKKNWRQGCRQNPQTRMPALHFTPVIYGTMTRRNRLPGPIVRFVGLFAPTLFQVIGAIRLEADCSVPPVGVQETVNVPPDCVAVSVGGVATTGALK